MILDKQQLITLDNMIKVQKAKGHIVFEDKLNIVGIRSKSQNAGKFDDILTMWWTEAGVTNFHSFTFTADPSDFYLKNPLSKIGCAILKPGQHIDKFCVSKHKGKYPALCQLRNLTVIRDYNKNGVLDYTQPTEFTSHKRTTVNYNIVDTWYKGNTPIYIEETGIFGLNIHRASEFKVVPEIGLYGAGCQVIQYPKGFIMFMDAVFKHQHKQNNLFSYTLLLEEDFDKYSVNPMITRSSNTSATPIIIANNTLSTTAKYGIRKTNYTPNI